MDDRMADPYEQQLLAVFNSCDIDRRGCLDRHGLSQLCDQLQLEEQGVTLIDGLLNGSSGSVTFGDFRDGLLAILGEGGQKGAKDSPDGEDLVEQEVSPKFVYGTKKYGRKTRPKTDSASMEETAATSSDTTNASDFTTDLNEKPTTDEPTTSNPHHPKKRRTSLGIDFQSKKLESASKEDESTCSLTVPVMMEESPTKWLNNNDSEVECLRNVWERLGVGRDGFLDRSELALVCDNIGLEKVAEEVVKEVFDTLDNDHDNHISFNEFLLLFRSGGRLNETRSQTSPSSKGSAKLMSPTSPERQEQLLSAVDDNSYFWSLDCNGDGFASADFILEIWERDGVHDGVGLLHNLGFTKSQVKIEELLDTLNSEISLLQAESETTALSETLLQASLSLCQTEARHLKSSLEQVYNERDKLRYDIAEANERASLLAQEVDDHHSQMEKLNKAHIKSMEQKHMENIKQLSDQLSQERDCLSQKNHVLESRLLDLEDLEIQSRSELAKSSEENATLYRENQALTEQLEKVELEYSIAQKELLALDNLRQGFQELELNNDNEKVRSLLDKLGDIQAENTKLRDRNDELTMKLEAMTSELNTISLKKTAAQFCSTPCVNEQTVEEFAEQTGDMADELAVPGGAIKRRGEPPQNALPFEENVEESPRLEKIGRFSNSPRAIDISGMQIRTLTPGGQVVDLMLSLDDKASYSISDPSPDMSKRVASTTSQRLSETDLSGNSSSSSTMIESLESQIRELQNQVKMLREKIQVLEEEKVHLCKENLKQNNTLSSLQSAGSKIQILEERETKELGDCVNAKEELEQQCQNLKSQIEKIKNILSERNARSKEYSALKSYLSDLEIGLEHCMSVNESATLLPQEREEGNVYSLWAASNLVEVTDLEINQTNGSEDQIKSLTDETKHCQDESSAILALEDEFLEKISMIEEKHTKEKIDLFKRCTDLESSIEMLRQEYEKCEDYWANKLEEERAMFDKDQKILDQKYKKILAEVKEYDEYFDKKQACTCSNKLDTIQEQEKLEAQVTDLENECSELHGRLESERMKQAREVKLLMDKLNELRSKDDTNGERLSPSGPIITETRGSWLTTENYTNRIKVDPQKLEIHTLCTPTQTTLVHYSKYQETKEKCRDVGTQANEEIIVGNSVQQAQVADSEMEEKMAAREHLLADIQALQQQKEELFEYIQEESSKYESELGCGKQACCVDLNVLQTMTTRWRQQEQRCRYLQFALKQRQQNTDNLLHSTWIQHKKEISELEIILEQSQASLMQQTLTNKEQAERLARNDQLVKDLYLENACLVATVQRLEQRCQVLAQMTTDSISV